MNKGRIFLLIAVMVAIAAFFIFDLGRFLNFETLKAKQEELAAYYAENRFQTIAIYFLIYVVSTALSLPGAAILTLAGGAVFGFFTGLVIVSFASSLGATGAFLGARYLLNDWVQGKFGERLTPINEGVKREGAFYLFALRLVPLFPFFVINLVMALTPIRTWTFYWVSQVGMLAGTAVYVNAGTQLSELRSLAGILSPKLILSFVLLGVFPIVAKRILGYLRKD